MRYTAVQKMYDVKRTMDEIAKREPVTVEAVTAYYASVRCSSAGENISKRIGGLLHDSAAAHDSIAAVRMTCHELRGGKIT